MTQSFADRRAAMRLLADVSGVERPHRQPFSGGRVG